MTTTTPQSYTYQDFIVRRPTVSDIAAIREVARCTWEATYSPDITPENQARVIANSYSDQEMRRSFERNWFWVVQENKAGGAVIGFAEVMQRQAGYSGAELTRIYVLPPWQSQHVGRALLAALLADLRSLRPDLRPPRLYLAVAAANARAIAFYERRGFQYIRDFQANLPGQLLDMQEYVIDV